MRILLQNAATRKCVEHVHLIVYVYKCENVSDKRPTLTTTLNIDAKTLMWVAYGFTQYEVDFEQLLLIEYI